MNSILLPMCYHGCGYMAVHQAKNGRWCCNRYVAKCPVIRKKNSIATSGENNPFFNHHHTPEGLKAIGLQSRGRKPFLGRNHKPKSLRLMSKQRTGKHPSEETREKNRIASTGKKMPPRTDEWREAQSEYMLNGGSKKANTKKYNGITEEKDLSNKELYYKRVLKYTNISIKEKFTDEELKQRGNKKELGHKSLDHVFSIDRGFKLGILPSIIGSKSNLELVDCSYNQSKSVKCDITLEELFQKFDEEKSRK